MCPDPIDEENWKQTLSATRSSCELDGAQPGKRCWFRVAGISSTGQGPWSHPASRPVM